jgi:hypothetical protein
MVKRDKKLSLFFYPDIYNKLYIMIKQTWEVSNEERNRILSLHESATKNFYLVSEQLVSVKQNRGVDKVISSRDPEIEQYLSQIDVKEYSRLIGIQSNAFKEGLDEMKGLMDELSLQVFEKMRVDNPKFYLYAISTYLGPARIPGRYGVGVFDEKKLKNKKIVVDNSVSIESNKTSGKVGEVPTVPIVEQGYEMITPPTVQQPMQFEFNEAIMTPEFMKYIDENIFGAIDEGIKNMTEEIQKEGRKAVDVYVDKIMLKSSSSTIPNGVSKRTFPGKVPTFKELSDERAKVVYNYLVQGLQKRNAYINPEGIAIDSNGTNAGKEITVKSGDKTLKLDGTGTSGAEYNGQNKQELIKNQRVELTFSYAVRGTTPPIQDTAETDDIPPALVPETANDFIVRFGGEGRKALTFRIPKINIPIFSKGGYYNKGVKLSCPPRGGW